MEGPTTSPTSSIYADPTTRLRRRPIAGAGVIVDGYNPMVFTCIDCGIQAPSKAHNRKRCDGCKDAWQKSRARNVFVTRSCLGCGADFEANRAWRWDYCSRKCRGSALRIRHPQSKIYVVDCSVCARSFTTRWAIARCCCARQCGARAQRLQHAKRRKRFGATQTRRLEIAGVCPIRTLAE
jgi:hypothetical protein